MPYSYAAVRAEVLRQLPELKAAVRTEEAEMAIDTDPASSNALIEDVVLPSLTREIRAGNDPAVIRHCDFATNLLSRGDADVRTLIVIGLVEALALDDELSVAVERLGNSDLIQAYHR